MAVGGRRVLLGQRGWCRGLARGLVGDVYLAHYASGRVWNVKCGEYGQNDFTVIRRSVHFL